VSYALAPRPNVTEKDSLEAVANSIDPLSKPNCSYICAPRSIGKPTFPGLRLLVAESRLEYLA
jgi:hypothetical protein